MSDTTHDPETDDKTTLAKVNDNPPAPDQTGAAVEEREDEVTVLARMNDNPQRTDDESS
jgi:hypothetical protein